jgi:predicted nucleotidyltransferase
MGTLTLDIPRSELAELCRRHRVRELAVFGSALRPDFGPQSDLDLLVEFLPDARIGFLALARLGRELSVLLGRPVDLVPKKGLKPAIRDQVLAEAEVIFGAG